MLSEICINNLILIAILLSSGIAHANNLRHYINVYCVRIQSLKAVLHFANDLRLLNEHVARFAALLLIYTHVQHKLCFHNLI
jgi:hypothetical protein